MKKEYCTICGTLKIQKNKEVYNSKTGKLATYLICPHFNDVDCKHHHNLVEAPFWKSHDFECTKCNYKEYPWF